jgi:hypothetical protein
MALVECSARAIASISETTKPPIVNDQRHRTLTIKQLQSNRVKTLNKRLIIVDENAEIDFEGIILFGGSMSLRCLKSSSSF